MMLIINICRLVLNFIVPNAVPDGNAVEYVTVVKPTPPVVEYPNCADVGVYEVVPHVIPHPSPKTNLPLIFVVVLAFPKLILFSAVVEAFAIFTAALNNEPHAINRLPPAAAPPILICPPTIFEPKNKSVVSVAVSTIGVTNFVETDTEVPASVVFDVDEPIVIGNTALPPFPILIAPVPVLKPPEPISNFPVVCKSPNLSVPVGS